jgi:hypothetical protein
LPQAPQFSGSLFTVTHALAQFWLPAEQVEVHLPPAHT